MYGIKLCFIILFAAATTHVATAQVQCSGYGMMSTTGNGYTFSWEVQSNGQYVDFNVSTDTDTDNWVAIGFNDDRFMPDADVVVGADDQTGFVEDRYNGAGRAGLLPDTTQNIMMTETMRDGNRITISFTRPIVSPDTSGQDRNLNVCRWVLWARGGTVGTFPTGSGGMASDLGGHNPTSRGSFSQQLCIQCSAASGVFVSLVLLMTAVLIAVYASF